MKICGANAQTRPRKRAKAFARGGYRLRDVLTRAEMTAVMCGREGGLCPRLRLAAEGRLFRAAIQAPAGMCIVSEQDDVAAFRRAIHWRFMPASPHTRSDLTRFKHAFQYDAGLFALDFAMDAD
jgi:hypothetical protein